MPSKEIIEYYINGNFNDQKRKNERALAFIIMYLSSILLFMFSFVITINYTSCFLKNNKDTLDNYIIDVLFSNSLTIIRCNPYERQIFRDITIETVGHLKCSNSHLFLPENHIEYITLLQWNFTSIKCSKNKKSINEEKTYFYIKHKAKNAFKNIKFGLIRVGSTGPSELKIDEKKFQLTFKHPPRNLAITDTNQNNESYTTDIYSFKNRPIICREKQLVGEGPCSNQHQNLTYVCYYKMGVAEPPTITELEDELKTLPNKIDPDGFSTIDHYINKTPIQKSSWRIWLIVGIAIIILIMIVVVICCCCCCQSKVGEHNRDIPRIDSDTSNVSVIS